MKNRFKFAVALLLGSIVPLSSQACPNQGNHGLDTVTFMVTERQWATTETANVSVSVDAALEQGDLVKARNDVMNNLKRIAEGDWQITEFHRSQDSSGLERLNVMAEARVPERALAKLHTRAQEISKPGTTYRIQHIDFTPSLEEMEKTRSQVRNAVYQRINNEIKQLNRDFSGQQYSVYKVDFTGVGFARRGQAPEATVMMAEPAMMVSNRVELSALVTVAASRPHSHDHSA